MSEYTSPNLQRTDSRLDSNETRSSFLGKSPISRSAPIARGSCSGTDVCKSVG